LTFILIDRRSITQVAILFGFYQWFPNNIF